MILERPPCIFSCSEVLEVPNKENARLNKTMGKMYPKDLKQDQWKSDEDRRFSTQNNFGSSNNQNNGLYIYSFKKGILSFKYFLLAFNNIS